MYTLILIVFTLATASALLFVKYFRLPSLPDPHVRMLIEDELDLPVAYPKFIIYSDVNITHIVSDTKIPEDEKKGAYIDEDDSMGKFFTLDEHDLDHIFWGEVTLNVGTSDKPIKGVVKSYTKNNYICLLCHWSEHLNISLRYGDTLNGTIKDLCVNSKNTGWRSTIERSIVFYLFLERPIALGTLLRLPGRNSYLWFNGVAEMSGYVFNASGEFTFPMVYYAKKTDRQKYPVLVGMEMRIPLTTFIRFFQTRNFLMDYEGYYYRDRTESEIPTDSETDRLPTITRSITNPYVYSSDDDSMQVYYD